MTRTRVVLALVGTLCLLSSGCTILVACGEAFTSAPAWLLGRHGIAAALLAVAGFAALAKSQSHDAPRS